MKFKYSGNLDKDIFSQFSETLTNFRIEELESIMGENFPIDVKAKLSTELVTRTNEYYKHGSAFKLMKKENQVRDHLIVFGRHFLSKICQDNFKNIYDKIPQSFRLGIYCPQTQTINAN